MSFPANIAKHRQALLEMLEEAFRDPDKRSVLRTRDSLSSSGVTSVPDSKRSRSRRFTAEYSLRKMLVKPRRRGSRLISFV